MNQNTKLQPVRGTHDILPQEASQRRFLFNRALQIAQTYGFGEISPPIFEFSDVFHRTLGDTSDVVSKETYSFTDRGGESLTLRPEFTAGVVRAFLSNGLQQHLPCRFFYHGPAFRYERPQKGRMRQFHQIGVETLGVAEPLADVETIALGWDILSALGIGEGTVLHLNSLGDAASRAAFRAALVEYFSAHKDKLSEDSRNRLEKNPLRILDSKDEGDKALAANAPHMQDYFTPEAKDFFAQVKEGLTALGIPYQENPHLVRGLDYYSHTVFEFVSDRLGAQSTVLAGGRYDGLVEQMGGQPTAGVGWAAGVERPLLAMQAEMPAEPRPVALVPLGEAAEKAAVKLAHELRKAGIFVLLEPSGNMGKRMKKASKVNARAAIIFGDDELAKNAAQLKWLDSGEQKEMGLGELAAALS